MIEFLENLILSNITEILTFALTAIVGFIGARVKAFINDETKRKVAKTVVSAVEQLYKDLSGAEKLQKAKESIVEMLNEKGINITELELNMLIEEVCNSFKQSVKESE